VLRRRSLSSLRVRLLLLVILAVLPPVALMLHHGKRDRDRALEMMQGTVLRVARLAANSQAGLVAGTRQLLIALARLPEVQRRDGRACSAIVAHMAQESALYANLGAIAPDGALFCSALPVTGSTSAADRAYFRRAVETRSFAVGDYQIGRVTRRATINLAYPAVDPQGALRAVVYAAVDLRWLNDLGRQAPLPPGSTLTVLDEHGTILVRHPEPEKWVGQPVRAAHLLERIRSLRVGVAEAAEGPDRAFIVGFSPLLELPAGSGNIYVSVGIPEARVLGPIRSALVRDLVLLGLVTIAGLAATWVGAQRLVVRPVDGLVTAARRVADGDLTARTGLSHDRGELGALARAFDDMATAVGHRQGDLETLFALDRALAQAHRSEDIAGIAAEHVMRLLGFDGAVSFLIDERAHVLRLLRAHGLPAVVEAESVTVPLGAGVVGRAVRDARPILRSMDEYPVEELPRAAAVLRDAGFATIASTPFTAHGTVSGALNLFSRRRIEPTDRALALLASVGTQIGLAVAHARERETLTDQYRLAALGRLAAGVAHELRNPLAILAGRISLLDAQITHGASIEQVARHRPALQSAVERMTRIMEGLSTYSKPRRPQPQGLDAGDLLGAIRELVAHKARAESVGIRLDVPAEPVVVWGDRARMMQILLNLATNAIEAMTGAGGQLTLRVRAAPGGVAVEIEDSGPGIPADQLSRIWDPFHTTKPEGTGLGLAIVRALTEELGAAITVDSAPGRGTTFRLTFPTPPAEPAPGC
jgi:signal transduction histidine kinase/HAMP domain-containing protein